MPVERRQVEGLEGLLREVLTIVKGFEPGRFLWFRGISCATYPLLPKIMREGKTGDQVLDRERRLATRFRQRSLAYWPAGYP